MTTTTNDTQRTNNLTDKLAITAVLAMVAFGLSFWFFGAIIAAWLSEMSRLSIVLMTAFVVFAVLGGAGYLIYLAVNGAINTAKNGIDIALHYEQINLAKATTAYKVAESHKIYAEANAMQYQIQAISATKGALVMVNGEAKLIPPLPQVQALPQLSAPNDYLEFDDDKLFKIFRESKAIHGLFIGNRNGGKSTLVNRLMNIEFQDYDTVIIDDLYNEVDSGWLLHPKAKVVKNFVPNLVAFYESHKKVADMVNVSRRNTPKRLLVIDEFPALLAQLKATNKRQYDEIMAMLRAIYSQGSHTKHNVMLLSQTVLSEDIGLSSNDKGNFIQVAIGKLSSDYLALRKGKDKRGLYERLSVIANEYQYYACFEDNNGTIDVQPLPDLSQFGAKRLYDQGDSEAMDEEPDSSSVELVIVESEKPTMADFSQLLPPEELRIVSTAQDLINEKNFSLSELHRRLTNGKQIGGNQSTYYKGILGKYNLLEAIKK